MKPNSCVYLATADVCKAQFGVTITSDIFDTYNKGEGILTVNIVTVLNEALQIYGIEVEAVYCRGLQGEFAGAELVREFDSPPFPAIVLVDRNHAEAVLSCMYASGIMAITLKRIT